MLGPQSRSHGESYRVGVEFFDLHAKCDGSHIHGQCAGRETRATQLYTEKIVRCILRGVTNQMLINNAYGRRYRPKVSDEIDHHESKSCACVIVNDPEFKVNEKTINEQLFINLHHPTRRCEGEAEAVSTSWIAIGGSGSRSR